MKSTVKKKSTRVLAFGLQRRWVQRVQRFLLPKIGAMNFVLDDVLDGGVNDSLNLDMHGKALSFHLLALNLRVSSSGTASVQEREAP